MKLLGMHRALKACLEAGKSGTGTPDELIAQLVEAEWADRQNRNIGQRIKHARFRYKADIDDLYYHNDRNLDRNQIMKFEDCSYIDRAECILITGSAGIGKSYIASALGHHACSRGYRVMYHNASRLFSTLKMSRINDSYNKEIGRIERQQLLILDDFGLQPLDAQSRTALMEVIEDRHGKSALIITSQVPVSKWYDIIGEPTIADAILDRIIHQAHRMELTGTSLRKSRSAECVMIA
ncbi:IS21-like element helper ATPase IstB [Niabella sp. CC-SYL272]|uniref:IS21-like element helper ATPase IstB n=1 Tax=Niabella agricola TaxID=2891571 RepID=UPI001F23EE29|nr:IS21-like element helper ATPase IstB [Niabella agricola]MCF3111927.1 IS21-like element helper ATPase IstB [Niabella agricola]